MSESPQFNYDAKTLYMRLLRYAWMFWPMFVTSILALCIYSSTNTAFLAAIKEVTDHGFVNKDPSRQQLLPWMLFGLLGIRAFTGFLSDFSMRWVSRRVIERIRVDAFARLMLFPVNFFDAHSAGMVTAKLTFNVEQVGNVASKVVISLVRDVLTIVGLVGYMLYLNWRLTLVFAVMTPMIVVYLRTMTPRIRNAGRIAQASVGDMTRILEESVSGQRVVKIFAGEAYENRRFAEAVGINRRMYIRLGRISGINSMVVEMIAAAALALIVYYSVGKFSAGEFAAFIGAIMMLIAPVKALTRMNEEIQVGLAAANSVFALMDAQPECDVGVQVLHRARGAIEFREVSLRYDNAKRDALNSVSLKVNPGEKVALVGRSGGGKSSLVALLPRFYEFNQGQLLLDGQDIRGFTLASLRAQFSLVSQDVVLFNDSVRNNIAYGVLRHASEAKIIAAAQAAHAWEFIQQLPQGLDSEVGDRGIRLSGGQRQRLAIARAILKDAPILLLDEATSALDNESEQHVQAALDGLMRNRTTLIVAHRLSTIVNADRILVMEQGTLVESGTHAELLALGGHYAKLYRKQAD